MAFAVLRPEVFKRSSLPALVSVALLSLCTIILVAMLLIMTAVGDIASNADEMDEQRAEQAASGALAFINQQMSSAISDYTAWDDAAKAVYNNHDNDWLVQNYGVFTGASALFDTYFLIGASREGEMAYKDGTPFSLDYKTYFGPAFLELFEGLKRGLSSGNHQVTGFVRTRDGVAAVGIAAVRSSDDKLTVPEDQAQFVIFVHHLTSAAIKKLAENFVIEGLALVEKPDPGQSSSLIKSHDGKTIGALVWSKRSPGSVSYAQVRPKVFRGLATIICFVAVFLIFGAVLVFRLSRDEQSARQQAKEDPLTGLANRRGLFETLDHLALEAEENRLELALVYLDLDRFKDINDAYGHQVGDQLIRAVTAGLKGLLPEGAVLARIGGDEFAVAFVSDDAVGAARRFECLVAGFFQEPLNIAGRIAAVGTSIGIAVSMSGAIKGGELLRRADMAMNRAKSMRNGHAVFFNAAMDDDREAKVAMAHDLRTALDADALSVVYQPVVDARTKRISGVEALVRWNREGHGMVPPDIFVSVAENTGLIDRLGEFVMRTAFQAAIQWPGIKVAVNVSPAQLYNVGFVNKTTSILKETGLSPERAVIEITEGFFIRNPERAKDSIFALQRIGMKVALDDFGSGFSSIGYLREFGFDRLKIDRSLTNALGKEDRAGDMLIATISLASSFDIPVTAEGIETEEQSVFLTRYGCEELQGYLFSKPVPAEEITTLLAAPAQAYVALQA